MPSGADARCRGMRLPQGRQKAHRCTCPTRECTRRRNRVFAARSYTQLHVARFSDCPHQPAEVCRVRDFIISYRTSKFAESTIKVARLRSPLPLRKPSISPWPARAANTRSTRRNVCHEVRFIPRGKAESEFAGNETLRDEISSRSPGPQNTASFVIGKLDG